MPHQIGVEIEFYGVSVSDAAALLETLYGGNIHTVTHNETQVKDSKFGDIKIELDAQLAHRISNIASQNKDNEIYQKFEQTGSELLRRAYVPVEVVFSPIDEDRLHDLDKFLSALENAGAQGTSSQLLFAFGVHLNISTDATDVAYFKKRLLAFFLLQYWLASKTRIDVSRIISGYNKLYPHKFGMALIQQDFKDLNHLINVYQSQIPDRNYALDMYPLWAYLNPEKCDNKHYDLVKPRPVFHYRLPDCKLGKKGWDFSQEYKWWQKIEDLATNDEKLDKMANHYQTTIQSFSDPLGKKWLDILKNDYGYDD